MEREENYFEENIRRKNDADGKMIWNVYWKKYVREDNYSKGKYVDWK